MESANGPNQVNHELQDEGILCQNCSGLQEIKTLQKVLNQDVFNIKANKKRPAVIGSARLQYNVATDSHRQNSEKFEIESHEAQSQF
jgi:hypothetical protein